MARALRIEFPGAFYHITSRGNEKKDIFRSRKDRERFLFYIESAAKRYSAAVHTYCLMTNHYHLLLETPHGNLSEIMGHNKGSGLNTVHKASMSGQQSCKIHKCTVLRSDPSSFSQEASYEVIGRFGMAAMGLSCAFYDNTFGKLNCLGSNSFDELLRLIAQERKTLAEKSMEGFEQASTLLIHEFRLLMKAER